MKNIFYILFTLSLLCTQTAFSQKSNATLRADSLRAINKARLDSTRAVNKARIDSIRSVNDARKDSLKTVREKNTEKVKKDVEARKAQLESTRKLKILPITQEMGVGFRLNSDGWSFFVNKGFIKTESETRHTNFIWFDLSEKRHPKETKTLNENFSIVNPGEPKPVAYKYGKINNFYQLKIGYGSIRPITGKLDKKSVQINWVYGAALSIGLIKPYYLDFLVPEGNGYIRKYDKYTEQNKEYFLDLNNQGTIVGGSDFTKGINGTKISPGLHIRSGFLFDYSAARKSFLGVEIGASAEVYTKDIPIMATTKNAAVFFNIYADFRFGRRWE